jgi:antitoxin VapB
MTKHAAIFRSNRSQAVRLPKDFAFPEGIDKVVIRKVGKSLVLTPPNALWDDFFDRLPCPDFIEPDDLPVQEREDF